MQQFSPRCVSQQTRIERWTKRSSPLDAHWRRISHDNVTTVFGVSPESRVQDDSGARIFSWFAASMFDCYGNVIVFSYNSSHKDLKHRGAARYISSIRYGNAKPYLDCDIEANTFYFEVFFKYSQQQALSLMKSCQSRYELDIPSVQRPDVFSSHRSGFEIKQTQLCTGIMMIHHFDELSLEESLIRSAEFSYNANPRGTLMTKIESIGYLGGTPLSFKYSGRTSSYDLSLHNLNIDQGFGYNDCAWIDMDATGWTAWKNTMTRVYRW